MLSIGEFSKLSMVTKKTLHHYDRIGLLKPVRHENGYRLYAIEQLRTMRLINRLKGYGFSLPEIAGVLARQEDSVYMAAMLTQRRQCLCEQFHAAKKLLHQLDIDIQMTQKGVDLMHSSPTIETKVIGPMTVYSLRRHIGMEAFGDLFGKVWQGVSRSGLRPAGPGIAVYHEEDFNPGDSDIELGVVVDGSGEGTRVLSPGLCACITHRGPYDQAYTDNYRLLAQWIAEHGYRVCGPVMDMYIRSVNEPDLKPEDYVTEICFPIEKA